MSLLSKVQSSAPPLPSRVVLYAGEGWGKSSVFAHSPSPLFLMSRGETGLLSLLEAARVPPTAYLPECTRWKQMEAAVQAVTVEDHPYRTLVIDTANGACDMLSEEVRREFFNDSQADFDNYGKGMNAVRSRWSAFLAALDDLRKTRPMSVILLHHAQVKSFADPAARDYDQHQPAGLMRCWELTRQWADVIAYGGLKVLVNKEDKAYGEARRFIRTEATPSIVAKNRYGLPPEIADPGRGAKGMWEAFAAAVRAAKAKGQPEPAQPEPAQPEPAQPEPAQPEPAQPEPANGPTPEEMTHEVG